MSAADDDLLREAERELRIKLAWVQEDWPAYVAAHKYDYRLKAIRDVFTHHGATPFEPDAVLSADFPSDFVLSLSTDWYSSGRHYDAQEWSWISRVLRNSGLSLTPLADQAQHVALPERVKLWRGFGCHPDIVEECARGFSWSLNRDVARSYAKATVLAGPSRNPYVATVSVPRAVIHSLFSLSGFADECVIDRPDLLRHVSIERLEA